MMAVGRRSHWPQRTEKGRLIQSGLRSPVSRGPATMGTTMALVAQRSLSSVGRMSDDVSVAPNCRRRRSSQRSKRVEKSEKTASSETRMWRYHRSGRKRESFLA